MGATVYDFEEAEQLKSGRLDLKQRPLWFQKRLRAGVLERSRIVPIVR